MRQNWWIYPGAALGLLVMVGATVMASLTNAYNTPAGSMRPSLEVGDHLFAWTGYYKEHAPERGEIVLFLHGDETVFIKRVIGLPGDTIQMKGGRLWINGTEVAREAQGSNVEEADGQLTQYRETLPGGVAYPILEKDDSSAYDETGPFAVPVDSYFVMGDNRDNSNDSRVEDFGFVPRDKFLDRPFLIYFSKTLSRIGARINQGQ